VHRVLDWGYLPVQVTLTRDGNIADGAMGYFIETECRLSVKVNSRSSSRLTEAPTTCLTCAARST
jgi:hypothetical protein